MSSSLLRSLATTALVFFVLFLEPSPLHAARVFYDRTVSFQVGRESPFSLWDWRQYHAKGIPNLHLVQRVLEVLLVVGALALGWFPRRRSPLRFAAFTAAVLVGFELVLTHWFYLYLPWFFPFVALALIAPLPGQRSRRRCRSSMSSPTPPRWLPSDDRVAASLAASAVFLARLGARAPVVLGARRDRRLADVPEVRRRDQGRPRSRTATSPSSTRPARCPCSRCRRSSAATTRRRSRG